MTFWWDISMCTWTHSHGSRGRYQFYWCCLRTPPCFYWSIWSVCLTRLYFDVSLLLKNFSFYTSVYESVLKGWVKVTSGFCRSMWFGDYFVAQVLLLHFFVTSVSLVSCSKTLKSHPMKIVACADGWDFILFLTSSKTFNVMNSRWIYLSCLYYICVFFKWDGICHPVSSKKIISTI